MPSLFSKIFSARNLGKGGAGVLTGADWGAAELTRRGEDTAPYLLRFLPSLTPSRYRHRHCDCGYFRGFQLPLYTM
jgi:hypothetical protein